VTSAAPLPAPPVPPVHFNFAAHLLARNAQRPSKAAFIDDQGTTTYGELDQRVRCMAAALRALGLRREERVLLFMHDCSDWPVSFLGALYAGVVPVAANTLLTAADCAYILTHCRAQSALVSAPLLPLLQAALALGANEVKSVIVSRPEEALPNGMLDWDALVQSHAPAVHPADTGADEPAFWLYSSGSTGRPKGTVHSHANPYWAAELYGRQVLGQREDDVCFSAAKLFFAYGLGNSLSVPMSAGATVLLMAERATPQATFRRWRGEIGGVRPTLFFGAPTGYAGLLAAPDLPRRDELALRLCSSAGEALPAEIGQRFAARFGVEIIDGIGSTEMLHIFLSNRPGQVRYGTTGWPVPGYDIELRGATAEGDIGDLYVRGPSAALMYWGNREKSRETFQGEWTRTGDKCSRNTDGSYTYAGRSDDMLKVSGIFVSPFEVEATLVQHPAVLEAAVIGVINAEGLTKTKAFVVLKAGQAATEAGLQAFVKDRLAPYKYPRQIEFVAELPKTATGKIQRFKLREREATAG